MPNNFKLNYSEFNRTLNKYAEFHKRRTAVGIVNKKALYIARGAIRETFRPEPTVIGKSLMAAFYVIGKNMRKKLKMRTTYSNKGAALSAPVAALLVNFLRGKKGEKGLQGPAMTKAIKSLIQHRITARAFLAAGWIPAVKALSPLVGSKKGMPDKDPQADKIKNPKGSVSVARESGLKTVATIINFAVSKFSTTKDPLGKYAQPALQRAINKETASMRENIEDEMRKAAKECGIKTN